MPTSPLRPAPLNNQLLAALPREDYTRLLQDLEQVELPSGKVLYEITDTVRHAYFPLSGMISLLAITENGNTIEIAMVGKEGMVGLPMALGTYKTPRPGPEDLQQGGRHRVDASTVGHAASGQVEGVNRVGGVGLYYQRHHHRL